MSRAQNPLALVPHASRLEVSASVVPPGPPDFEAIYAEHFDFAWRCLRSLGVPVTRLDDAAQEVFVVVHRRLGVFRGDSSLRTWVFGIVRRVAHNQRRTLQRKAVPEPLDQEPPSVLPTPLEVAQDAEAAAFLRRFLDGLDARKREIFVLCVLEELSVPEAAEMLSVPLNTAYTRLRSARAEFRRTLARLRDDDAKR